MAKKVKIEDLRSLLETSFKSVFKCPPCTFVCYINSISAYISTDTAYSSSKSQEYKWDDDQKFQEFNEVLRRYAGDNLKLSSRIQINNKPHAFEFIIQVEYEIID